MDVVLPGENWFFYWKTSASLWESKLEQMSATKVIIPINWSFHSETGSEYDFAGKRPETDIKRLYDLIVNLNKEAIFLLPVSPVPFLPNGGVPHLLARNLSKDQNGMIYTISDGNSHFNKLYSFFDTRIYKAFCKFVNELGTYFSQSGIAGDIHALECGYLDSSYFNSYFFDSSRVFSNAFSNYLQAKRELETDGVNDAEDLTSHYISDPIIEKELKDEFKSTILNFYISTAKKALNTNWVGSLKVSFIGGKNSDFINRIYSKESGQDYVQNIFESLCIDTLVSSVLVDGQRKRKLFGRILEEIVTNSFSSQKFNETVFDEVGAGVFKPLVLFNLLYNDDITKSADHWAENHLLYSISKEYKWLYKKCEIEKNDNLEMNIENNQLFFVAGDSLTKKSFNKILKIFLNGGKIMIDTAHMCETLERRLQSFIIENSLHLEKVNYMTQIDHAFLGEGRLVIFNGKDFKESAPSKMKNFWLKLISSFEQPYLKINAPDEIEYYWRTRDSNSNELNYEEVRRVNFYNPSSYKKKVTIYLQKNFALLKKIDEMHVKVKSNNYEVEVELLPEGSVSFDFGMYSL